MEVRCYSEGSNKGSNLASSARVVADIAVEPSKDPHALYVSKVEREQVHEAIQQPPWSFVRSSCCASTSSCPTRKSLLFWGARQGQSCRASEGLDRNLECCLSDTSQTRDRREKESCE